MLDPKENPKEFAEDMMRVMKIHIDNGDNAIPMLFIVGKDGNNQIVAMADMDEKSKDKVASIIRMFATAPNTQFVVFLSDSWVAEGKTDDKGFEQLRRQYKQVKDMPGRREAITCTIVGIGIKPIVGNWKYSRDENNKPMFDEKVDWLEGDDSKVTGRFAPDLSKGAEA